MGILYLYAFFTQHAKNTKILVLPVWQEVRIAFKIAQYSLLRVETTTRLEQ